MIIAPLGLVVVLLGILIWICRPRPRDQAESLIETEDD